MIHYEHPHGQCRGWIIHFPFGYQLFEHDVARDGEGLDLTMLIVSQPQPGLQQKVQR